MLLAAVTGLTPCDVPETEINFYNDDRFWSAALGNLALYLVR